MMSGLASGWLRAGLMDLSATTPKKNIPVSFPTESCQNQRRCTIAIPPQKRSKPFWHWATKSKNNDLSRTAPFLMPNKNGTCFVVMGFAKKTDFESGRTYDLDKSYQNMIKPAVEAAGLACVRADEIVHSG